MSDSDRPVGRPSDFSRELADLICERIADGESLRSICLEDAMPNKATVFRWLAKNSVFCDQYARAREVQADLYFDEIMDIADDGSNDWIKRTGRDGQPFWVENGEAMRRSQLRVDARKWVIVKMLPKKYGDLPPAPPATSDLSSDAPILRPDEPIPASPKL